MKFIIAAKVTFICARSALSRRISGNVTDQDKGPASKSNSDCNRRSGSGMLCPELLFVFHLKLGRQRSKSGAPGSHPHKQGEPQRKQVGSGRGGKTLRHLPGRGS